MIIGNQRTTSLRDSSGLFSSWLLTASGSSRAFWVGCGLCSHRLQSPQPTHEWARSLEELRILFGNDLCFECIWVNALQSSSDLYTYPGGIDGFTTFTRKGYSHRCV